METAIGNLILNTQDQDLPPVKIKNRLIGDGHAPMVVAEMSGNHNGDINRALSLLTEAKKAGAEAVKIQTYRPDTITIDHDGPEFTLKEGTWAGRRLYELYDEAHTPWEWHEKIFQLAKELDLIVFSSPFDDTAVDFLESLDCPAYKIASPEVIDIPLIQKVASTGKPMIISTGMASYSEIEEAIIAARELNPGNVIVLHCTSSYPAMIEDANLATIESIRKNFNVLTGLSDHTTNLLTSILSVGLGACLIEKHFTLNRLDGGVDSSFSLEVDELRELIQSVKSAWLALGRPAYSPLESESIVFKNRRSLYAVSDINKGEVFTNENVKSIRPGFGLKPKLLPKILGQKANRSIKFGEPISEDMLSRKLSNEH